MTQGASMWSEYIQNAAVNNITYWVGMRSTSPVTLMTFSRWITAVIVVQHFLFFWTNNLIYILGYISIFHVLSQPHFPVSRYTPEDA